PSGADISIRLSGDEPEALEAASARVKRELAKFDGVYDISDDNALGQLELQVRLKPWARAQGFTEENVARQLRGYLFGIDAHTFAERREDIDVRVRVGEVTRRDLSAVSNAWIISPAGEPVPLPEIAEITEDAAYATIKRAERKRAITITADTSPRVTTNSIVQRLTEAPDAGLLEGDAEAAGGVAGGVAGEADGDAALSPLQRVELDFPGVEVELVGEQEQQREAFASLPWGFAAAIVMIYVILAWLFSSYFQPVIVLLAVPFSLVGVLWGHFIMGYDLTFLSRIGFVALAGIVVNDSLIYVRFYNDMLARGLAHFDAALAAGRARFRAIMLTTITTVLGLTPLILEQSFQAKFLIPMAIAIAGGLISATLLILVLLPCFLLIFEDIKDIAHFFWHGRRRSKHETQRPAEKTYDTLAENGAGDVPAAQASAV
ncbi:MAG: efflux RND transporter permease subunit, partial [Phycisphaeraceae bacterium]